MELCKLCQETRNTFINLTYIEVGLVEKRSGVVGLKNICETDYLKYIVHYALNQKTCCDPWKKHRKPSKNRLVEISLDIASNCNKLNLVPGQKLCRACHNEASKIQSELSSSEEDAASQSSIISLEDTFQQEKKRETIQQIFQ